MSEVLLLLVILGMTWIVGVIFVMGLVATFALLKEWWELSRRAE